MMDHKTLHGLRPSCFHRKRSEGLIRYLALDDVLMATDSDDISIRSTEQMEKYDSLYQ
jgi:hypothetical protein